MELEARMDRLEREARRWRFAAFVFAGTALVALLAPQVVAQRKAGEPTVVKAPFFVETENGRRLFSVQVSKTGTGSEMVVYNQQSAPVVRAIGEQGGFVIAGGQESQQATLHAGDGGASVHLKHSGGQDGVSLLAGPKGGLITLRDANGQARFYRP